jgi:hypothetical protein
MVSPRIGTVKTFSGLRSTIDEHRIVETTVKDCQLLEPRRLDRRLPKRTPRNQLGPRDL